MQMATALFVFMRFLRQDMVAPIRYSARQFIELDRFAFSPNSMLAAGKTECQGNSPKVLLQYNYVTP